MKDSTQRKRFKSASDERMKGWSSDNDTMNSPEYNESCQVMRNTKRVYEDVHPVTRVQLNKIITAIGQDLSSIDFKDASSH